MAENKSYDQEYKAQAVKPAKEIGQTWVAGQTHEWYHMRNCRIKRFFQKQTLQKGFEEEKQAVQNSRNSEVEYGF